MAPTQGSDGARLALPSPDQTQQPRNARFRSLSLGTAHACARLDVGAAGVGREASSRPAGVGLRAFGVQELMPKRRRAASFSVSVTVRMTFILLAPCF